MTDHNRDIILEEVAKLDRIGSAINKINTGCLDSNGRPILDSAEKRIALKAIVILIYSADLYLESEGIRIEKKRIRSYEKCN